MDNHIAHNDIQLATDFRGQRGEFDYEKAFDAFKKKHMRKRHGFALCYLAVAASITAVFAIFSYRYGRQSVEKIFADITISVPEGSITKTVLPDGTNVHLNSCSSITYSQGFGVKNRNVRISGEACFEVTHNEDIPFIVNSGNLEVTVLGTVFNFRDYPKDVEAAVSLSEGRVSFRKLSSDDRAVSYLNPGQSLVLDKQNGRLSVSSNDVANSMLWIEGTLFFDELMLCDIARELERAYNVQITIADSKLSEMRIYGSFMIREQRIEDILDILSSTNHLHYLKTGSDITIY